MYKLHSSSMRVYEKCSNLKRQKTNLQHKQTTPLAYPPWVKSKFEANSHHSPPSFSVKQKERSSLSVHYNRWICIGRGLYLLPFDWLYYDMQSSVPEPRKKILDMQSSVPLLSCAAQARSIMPVMAVLCPTYPRIQELFDKSTLPRSHHPDQLLPFTVATEPSIQHSPWY